MKFENVLIIALIAMIFVVIGAYLFVNANHPTDNQVQQPIINNSPNVNSVSNDVHSSAQSSGSSSSSEAPTSSSNDASSDSSAQNTPSDSSSSDSSTPQAGQAEGTYDPTDFD